MRPVMQQLTSSHRAATIGGRMQSLLKPSASEISNFQIDGGQVQKDVVNGAGKQ